MGEIEEYINANKKFIAENGIEKQIEIIRFVYIALGQYLQFNPNFSYGNQEQLKQIYKNDQDCDEIYQSSMKTHIVTCKATALLLEKILGELGIDVRTETEEGPYDDIHYYNIVRVKKSEIEGLLNKNEFNIEDSNEEYVEFKVDLQKDLHLINTESKTQNFAIDIRTGKPLIKDDAQKNTDLRIGYIKQHYLDDMLNILKIALKSLTRESKGKSKEDKEALVTKSKLILDSLQLFVKKSQEGVGSVNRLVDYYSDGEDRKDGLGFIERLLYHKRMFGELYTKYEKGRVHNIPCSVTYNGKKKYYVCVAVDVTGDDERLFIHSPEKGIYEEISFDEFYQKRKNGLKIERYETQAMKKSFSQLEKTNNDR